MSKPINAQWMHWPQTQQLLAVCKKQNIEVRFVGGCVRDSLLGRPVIDVDLATPTLPELVMERLQSAHLHVIPTGISHGTVTVHINGKNFEITTLRKDVSTDGRHATVAYTNIWEEDAARRDFTINALYADAEGNLYDYFSGQEDLNASILRFIGNPAQRISEDYLRILRYFRFLSQLAFHAAHPDVLDTIEKLAPQLSQLSGERITAEMLKLLSADYSAVLQLMQTHKVLESLGIHSIGPVEALAQAERTYNVPAYALRTLACMLLAHQDAAEMLTQLAQRWKLSNHQKDTLRLLITVHGELNENTPIAEQKKLLRRIRAEAYKDSVLLAAAYRPHTDYKPLLDLANTWTIPQFPVTGQDLLGNGMKPGPDLGKKLKELEIIWEEGGYTATKEQLLCHPGLSRE